MLAETYQLNAEVLEPSLRTTPAAVESVIAEVGEENAAAQRLRPGDVIDGRWADEPVQTGHLP